jgi:hypothetical protein
MTKVILKTITPKEKAKRQRAKERSRLVAALQAEAKQHFDPDPEPEPEPQPVVPPNWREKQQRRLDTMAEMKAAAAKLRARVTP